MAELRDATALIDDPAALRARMREDGYVLLRGVVDPDLLAEAADDVRRGLVEVGWMELDADGEARPAGTYRGPGHPEFAVGYIHVQRSEAVHRIPFDDRLFAAMRALAGDDVFVRPSKNGRIVWPHANTWYPHEDYPLIHGMGTADMFTTWVPFTDCPRELGSLQVLAGSIQDGAVYGRDFPEQGAPPAVDVAPDDPRWHRGDLAAGDVLVFHAFTVHTALENVTDRMRLSCDYRWQSASFPIVDAAVPPHYFPQLSWAELSKDWTSDRWGRLPDGVEVRPYKRLTSDQPIEPSAYVA